MAKRRRKKKAGCHVKVYFRKVPGRKKRVRVKAHRRRTGLCFLKKRKR